MNEWLIVVPKNSSLKSCREVVETLAKDEGIKNERVLEVRGEDVAFFVDKLAKQNKKVMGITGEDLFREWQLKNPSDSLDIIRRYEWRDKEAMFGKPVLSLLGPKGKKLEDLSKNLKIAISDKYTEISKHYLDLLEKEGYKFEKVYLSGSVELAFLYGIADIIIDIVYTGKSAEEVGLKCYNILFEADVVVIGKRESFIEIPKISIKK